MIVMGAGSPVIANFFLHEALAWCIFIGNTSLGPGFLLIPLSFIFTILMKNGDGKLHRCSLGDRVPSPTLQYRQQGLADAIIAQLHITTPLFFAIINGALNHRTAEGRLSLITVTAKGRLKSSPPYGSVVNDHDHIVSQRALVFRGLLWKVYLQMAHHRHPECHVTFDRRLMASIMKSSAWSYIMRTLYRQQTPRHNKLPEVWFRHGIDALIAEQP
ncbi:hypothetical protein M405DRAFT_836929 [Rhizopogon salebrosus TDB-379]|nr:hypothetical protein M405DRAFT_836929 [Rhizopogon salebrosus TDB-379]